jgi:uncharacterized membrane protein YfcA
MILPELSLTAAVQLFFAGLVAGMANAIAGGGTLFSFPVFLASGLPPVVANASNAVAVWPGHALATFGYRRELQDNTESLTRPMLISAAGGVLGAYLLSVTHAAVFTALIPPLILGATVLFAFGPRIQKRLLTQTQSNFGSRGLLGIFIFSIYGGYFGAGLGIMLMAGLMLLGITDPHRNNALKNLLAAIITSIGVVVLALTGLIAWPHTLTAFAGALIGGLYGSRLARLLPVSRLRIIVITLGLLLSTYYVKKYYL